MVAEGEFSGILLKDAVIHLLPWIAEKSVSFLGVSITINYSLAIKYMYM